MEKSLVDGHLTLRQLEFCAKGIINTAKELARKDGISKIFLALDLSPDNMWIVSSLSISFFFLLTWFFNFQNLRTISP